MSDFSEAWHDEFGDGGEDPDYMETPEDFYVEDDAILREPITEDFSSKFDRWNENILSLLEGNKTFVLVDGAKDVYSLIVIEYELDDEADGMEFYLGYISDAERTPFFIKVNNIWCAKFSDEELDNLKKIDLNDSKMWYHLPILQNAYLENIKSLIEEWSKNIRNSKSIAHDFRGCEEYISDPSEGVVYSLDQIINIVIYKHFEEIPVSEFISVPKNNFDPNNVEIPF